MVKDDERARAARSFCARGQGRSANILPIREDVGYLHSLATRPARVRLKVK